MSSKVDLLLTAQDRLRRYGQYDIGNRHIPDGRDGLKPVQRRILWAMHKMGVVSLEKHAKQAKIMGYTTGTYHPHGEASVATAMVNMSQTRTASPFIIGIGNWGSYVDGAAAPRYISAYLSKFSIETFLDPDELAVVDMLPNYDGTEDEPLYLPAKFPNFLLQGCSGISYGFKVEVPPLTPEWIVQAIKHILANQPKKVQLPTEFNYRYGGRLVHLDKAWLKTGSGKANFLPTIKVYAKQRKLILTSLVPNMNVQAQLEAIREFPYVTGVFGQDGTDKDGMFTIEVKRGTDLKVALKEINKKLYSHASFNFIHVVRKSEEEFQPFMSNPIEFLTDWLKWRLSFIKKVAAYKITKIKKDSARLDLLLRLIANRDKIMVLLKTCKSREILGKQVMKVLKCSSEEATYILSVAIVRLSNLEKQDLLAKIAANNKAIKLQRTLIAKPSTKLHEDIKSVLSTLKV